MKFVILYVIGVLNLFIGYLYVRRCRATSVEVPRRVACDELTPMTADEALAHLIAELSVQYSFFHSQSNTLREDGLSLAELEEVAAEIGVAAQSLLQTITAASDVFVSDESQSWDGQVDELEQYWANISDATLQLVTLSFEDEATESTRDQLIQTCQEVQQICEEARQTIEAPGWDAAGKDGAEIELS